MGNKSKLKTLTVAVIVLSIVLSMLIGLCLFLKYGRQSSNIINPSDASPMETKDNGTEMSSAGEIEMPTGPEEPEKKEDSAFKPDGQQEYTVETGNQAEKTTEEEASEDSQTEKNTFSEDQQNATNPEDTILNTSGASTESEENGLDDEWMLPE